MVSSLAKRKAAVVAQALRIAAKNPQAEVRVAVLWAIADIPDSSNDTIIESATHAGSAAERRTRSPRQARGDPARQRGQVGRRAGLQSLSGQQRGGAAEAMCPSGVGVTFMAGWG